ncbi:MAG: CBS domain-containing protein [Nitrososphaeraceae archaeon]|nr:CBS domain-containing protein [Nitrososphaeraceae archaeon]MBV9668538.1 CBS domain-containing protein [Nitrososphaeraceae archaeon]
MYSIALSENIGKIASLQEFITLDQDTEVAEAAKVMRDKDTSCILVVSKDSKDPIGIITERDMLYRVLAENLGPYKVTLKKIMSTPLITIDHQSSVADAVSLMRSKHIRRLVVTKNQIGNRTDSSSNDRNQVIGMVSLVSITGNSPSNNIDLAELEVSSDILQKESIKVVCPYCQSRFQTTAEMSKHIDQIHIGKGLLEGDLRRW